MLDTNCARTEIEEIRGCAVQNRGAKKEEDEGGQEE